MKLASFRLRIALLSVALAGGALVSFGLIAWRLIYLEKVRSLDTKLEGQLQRMVVARSPDWWKTFNQELPNELETQTKTPITMLAVDAKGRTLHYSVSEAQLGHTTLDMGQIFSSMSDTVASKATETTTTSHSAPAQGVPQISTQQTPNGSWRIGIASAEVGKGAIAVSLQTIDQEMALIRKIFLVSIPSTLLVIAAGAWVLAGSALRPVHKLTNVIKQVTATGLDQQVPTGSADVEFVELIEVFNQMLTRLERSFKQSSRFSGDAAHELKTPLAILRGELELVMHQAKPGSELQQSLSRLMDEVSRLSTIVRKLLLLSLADAGQMSVRQAQVDMAEILAVLIEDIELLDPDLPVTVDLDKKLLVKGDRDLLTQLLQNLIDNAIKYNLPEGSPHRRLSIVGRRQVSSVKITVVNASRDIPPEERDRLFDRFYRGDLSRNRKREGFGLGLSLSREIARSHRGDLWLDQTPKGETGFTLTLPASVTSKRKVNIP
ncbi:MAG: Signal transduction histidine kinase [Phormidesmis priestleyi Ana]|uniref:histidine kinase n=1 Tax=Phormidesmis priestleyi Ana TaxID=1666911 RepID=A0A0P8A2M1_9CYAN|nr:MAG: Signal transduction histidine kinase [Phormidesmis priestleyi Ana]